MTGAGIVADDLTGAADSAVHFARAGWQARLVLGDEIAGGGNAVVGPADDTVRASPSTAPLVRAIVTDARALDAAAARSVTAEAVSDLMRRGVDRVLLKIDSTMRGAIGPQVTGALEAWRTRHPDAFAVVSPAYPELGRTVEDGRLLVDGAGVETTSVGRDPVTPVTTSSLAELLPGSAHVAVGDGDARDLAVRLVEAAAAGAEVITVDGITDADLATTAQAVQSLGVRAVPVGSAGLAVALSRAWASGRDVDAISDSGSAPAHVVVVLSSLHDASRTQYRHLVGAPSAGGDRAPTGIRTVAPSLAEVRAGDLDSALARAGAGSGADRVTVVLAPPRAAGETADEAVAEAPTVTLGPTDAERVADALAVLTDRIVDDVDRVGLVLVGGEGARAVLRRLGATSLRVLGAVREGVPHGILEGGRLHGMPVVTKAGGFGPAETLTDTVRVLLGGLAAGPATAPATNIPPSAHTAPHRPTSLGDRS